MALSIVGASVDLIKMFFSGIKLAFSAIKNHWGLILILTLIVSLLFLSLSAPKTVCEFDIPETEAIKSYRQYKNNLSNYNQYLEDKKEYDSLTDEQKNVRNPPKMVDTSEEVTLSGKLKFLSWLGCDEDYNSSLETGFHFVGDTLGFDEGVIDFFYPHFFPVGFLIGFWLWGSCKVILLTGWTSKSRYRHNKKTKHEFSFQSRAFKGTLIYVIAGSWWKALIIAITYAALMVLPFVNPLIDVITFSFLRNNLFLRSILLALYIGLIPSLMGEYKKYKMRKYYTTKVEERRQERRYIDQVARS